MLIEAVQKHNAITIGVLGKKTVDLSKVMLFLHLLTLNVKHLCEKMFDEIRAFFLRKSIMMMMMMMIRFCFLFRY